MELKALSVALFVAFFTVIMDAVFNFHYIYVLIILVITGYVLVRLLAIVNTKSDTKTAQPSEKEKTALSSVLKSAATDAKVNLDLEPENMNHIIHVNKEAFRQALAAGFRAFGMKIHGKTSVVRSGKQKLIHLTLTVNRKAGNIQDALDPAIHTLCQLVSVDGGSAWQNDIPRKTELHILIPGN